MEKRLGTYLKTLIKNGGSDLHLKSGANVRVRINGTIKLLGQELVTPEEMEELAKKIMDKELLAQTREQKASDFTYLYDEMSRFRVNFFRQINGWSAVFRLIPVEIPSIDSLNMPGVVEEFATLERGDGIDHWRNRKRQINDAGIADWKD
jgi:twitching motility protein PilT